MRYSVGEEAEVVLACRREAARCCCACVAYCLREGWSLNRFRRPESNSQKRLGRSRVRSDKKKHLTVFGRVMRTQFYVMLMHKYTIRIKLMLLALLLPMMSMVCSSFASQGRFVNAC